METLYYIFLGLAYFAAVGFLVFGLFVLRLGLLAVGLFLRRIGFR